MLKSTPDPKSTPLLVVAVVTNMSYAAVLYSDWSLQMGQAETKMTLGTLTMSRDDFPGV